MPAYQEVADFLRTSSAFVILMGAGASLSSGGSTTLEIAREKLVHVGRFREDLETDDESLSEAFFEYIANLQGRERYDFLSGYFDALFPNIGHVYLAKIAEAAFSTSTTPAVLNLPPTILTTNFDYLIESALARWSHLLPGREFNTHVFGLADEVLAAVQYDPRRLKVVKVYGDVYAKIMRFTGEETHRFSPDTLRFLREQLSHPLLVLGYSARDGLGDLLLETKEDVPVWWVSPTSPFDPANARHQDLAAFLKRRNRRFAESRVFAGADGDFDGFMSSLYTAVFNDEAACQRVERDHLPQVMAGRPPEPFPHARSSLRELARRLRAGAPMPRSVIAEALRLSGSRVARMLKHARELEPRYDFVETEAGVTVQERSMTHAEKLRLNPQNKSAIGHKAAEQVRSGALVLIDGGTTTLEVARALADRCRELDSTFTVTIVTNAVEITRLADPANSRLKLWLVGGEVRSESLDTMGAPAAQALRAQLDGGTLGKHRADICFVGATGISLNEGFCVRTALERDIKAAMLELSHKKVVVADSTKFRPSYPGWNTFASLSRDVIVVTNDSETPLDDFHERVDLVLALPV